MAARILCKNDGAGEILRSLDGRGIRSDGVTERVDEQNRVFGLGLFEA